MKTFLAMGQSHVAGAGLGGIWDIPCNVQAWNSVGDSDSASMGLGSVWISAPPINSAPFNNKNNLMAHAVRYLAAELAETIRLSVIARSGTEIGQWMDAAGNPGPMYIRMVNVLAAAGITTVDGLLWHQGEADSLAGTASTYAAKFGSLLARMESDGYITGSTPVVIGELNLLHTAMNSVLRSIASQNARIGIADISTFRLNGGGDNHFSGPSCARAGLEYAKEYLKLAGVPDEETERYFVAACGCADLIIPQNIWTKVPVKAETGRKDLISSGCFVADRRGTYRFSLGGFAGAENTYIAILDDGGGILKSSAHSAMADYVAGDVVLARGEGDNSWLGVYQTSTPIVSVPATASALINRLVVEYLGRW